MFSEGRNVFHVSDLIHHSDGIVSVYVFSPDVKWLCWARYIRGLPSDAGGLDNGVT